MFLISCDSDPTPVADLARADLPRADGPRADQPARVPELRAERSTLDLPGAQKLGQGCCAVSSPGCGLGTCESGLECFVVSNGPYVDRGICSKPCTDPVQDCTCPTTAIVCPGGTPTCEQGRCMWLCLPGTQGCDSSQPCKCSAGLSCRSVQGRYLCLP
jgi:hypothetical protein